MENFQPSLTAAVPQVGPERTFAPGVLVVRLEGAIGPDKPINVRALRQHIERGRHFRHLHLEITSIGGNAAEAFELYHVLRSLPFPVSARASKECLSAGMIVLMAADLRIAAADVEFLIHPTSYGREDLPERLTASILRDRAEVLAANDLRVAELFADRTGHGLEWFRKEKETEDLLSEADAVAMGLVHEFETLTGPVRPGWPSVVRAAVDTGGIYFPDWLRSENYFSACRCAGSLYSAEANRP